MTTVLDEEDIYQISYLTLHGWNYVYGRWEKEGITQKVSETHSCGCCAKEVETPHFSRSQAFDKQFYELSS